MFLYKCFIWLLLSIYRKLLSTLFHAFNLYDVIKKTGEKHRKWFALVMSSHVPRTQVTRLSCKNKSAISDTNKSYRNTMRKHQHWRNNSLAAKCSKVLRQLQCLRNTKDTCADIKSKLLSHFHRIRLCYYSVISFSGDSKQYCIS